MLSDPSIPDPAQARMDDLMLDRFDRWLDRIAPLEDTHPTHNDEEEETHDHA